MKETNKILRIADGVDSAAEIDPLSEAAGGVNTDFPVLAPDRILRFEVKSCSKMTNEETKAESIKIALRLTGDTQNATATFRDGGPAREGFTVNQYIGITPTDKYTIQDIKRNAALWMKAVLGQEVADKTSFREFFNKPSMFEGFKVDCKTGISKDKTGAYPDSTRLTPVLPA